MASRAKKQPKNPDKDCQFPTNPSCPFNSGIDSPYRYQLGCRGEACKAANREYYRNWRNSKVEVPVKKAKAKKPTTKRIVKVSGK